MAFAITGQCIACYACEPLCPVVAIDAPDGRFRIDSDRCCRCQGHYDQPQCRAVCPVDAAIVDITDLSQEPLSGGLRC